MDHKLNISDGFKMQEKAGTADASVQVWSRKEYEVVSESGLFKNGKQYDKGDKISLVEKAAANFLASVDIKEIGE